MCCNKFFHFLWSFKPVILLYYSLFREYASLLDAMAIEVAIQESYECDWHCIDLDQGIWGDQNSCSWYGYSATDACYPLGTPSTTISVCFEEFKRNGIAITVWVILSISSLYGLIIFVKLFLKSPTYKTLGYYAFLHQSKKSKDFKYYVRFMFGVILLQIFLLFFGMVYIKITTGFLLTQVIATAFACMIISGFAVAELRTTNEIHFKYDIPDDDIILSPPRCGLITADDMFERLEEAVTVYVMTRKIKLLSGY